MHHFQIIQEASFPHTINIAFCYSLQYFLQMYFVIKDPKGENVFSSKSLSGVEPKSPNTKHEEEIVTLKKRVQELETTMSTSTKVKKFVTSLTLPICSSPLSSLPSHPPFLPLSFHAIPQLYFSCRTMLKVMEHESCPSTSL